MQLNKRVLKALIRAFGVFILWGSFLATLLGSTHLLHPREGADDYRFLFYFGLAGIVCGVGLAFLRKWGALILAFVGVYYAAWVADGIRRVGLEWDQGLVAAISLFLITGPGISVLLFWRVLSWRGSKPVSSRAG